MKIYYIPVPKSLKPVNQKFNYPKHNNDIGVEQIFDKYILSSDNLTHDHRDADFHYLSIYWTRFFLNNNYGDIDIESFSSLCNSLIIDSSRTFTICQYDDGPLVDLEDTILFLSSRKTKTGIDIPLISKQLVYRWFRPKKIYLASFVGRLVTHPIRTEMYNELKDEAQSHIVDQTSGTFSYMRSILSSYVSLCPRGYGGSSFRFFESMQLGTVPFLIGDIDTRPFKKFVDWTDISFFTDDPKLISSIIREKTLEELILMGIKSNSVYRYLIENDGWCDYVLLELNDLGND
jgi:hypothetical protein